MEHCQRPAKTLLCQPFLSLFFIFLLSGCHKPLPNPEASDFIYSDLQAEEETAKRAVAEQEVKLDGLKKDLAKMSVLDSSRKRTISLIRTQSELLDHFRQMELYEHARVESRRAQDIDRYARAFGTEKESHWLDDVELEQYKVQKRLQNASRRWDAHIPKSKFIAASTKNGVSEQKTKKSGQEGGGSKEGGKSEHE